MMKRNSADDGNVMVAASTFPPSVLDTSSPANTTTESDTSSRTNTPMDAFTMTGVRKSLAELGRDSLRASVDLTEEDVDLVESMDDLQGSGI